MTPYEVSVVEAGRFKLDGGAMFGIVPKVLWHKFFPVDEDNRIPMAMRCLLLTGEGRRILVDTGLTPSVDDTFKTRYGVDFSRWNLLSSLGQLGVTPEDITDVILTHLHFDHGSGAVILDAGTPKLVFPKAQHYVQRSHLHWALNPPYRERASYLRGFITPLAESGQLKLLKGGGEILPGVTAMMSDGHTIGLQLIKAKTVKGVVVYCADLIPTSAHVGLAYGMAYDIAPLTLIKEKEWLLSHAAKERWTLVLEHDPSAEAITVERDTRKGGYRIAERPSLSI